MLSSEFQPAQINLYKEHLGLIYLPKDIGEQEEQLVNAFEHLAPPLSMPLWIVSHQELRTNLRIRRVFDFLSAEFRQSLIEK